MATEELRKRAREHSRYMVKYYKNLPPERWRKRRDYENAWAKEYRRKNRDRINARKAVTYYLQKGVIVRPIECSACGSEERKIEAHHHNGYAKEHRLDVIWLCTTCHAQVHHCQS